MERRCQAGSERTDECACAAWSSSRPRLMAVSPVAWPSTGVRNGDDVDVVVRNAVNDVLGKTRYSKLTTRNPAGSWRTDFGVRPNQVDRADEGIVEIAAQARSTVLVPSDGLDQLLRGGIAEVKRLHRPRMSFSIRRLTCSQGSSGIEFLRQPRVGRPGHEHADGGGGGTTRRGPAAAHPGARRRRSARNTCVRRSRPNGMAFGRVWHQNGSCASGCIGQSVWR